MDIWIAKYYNSHQEICVWLLIISAAKCNYTPFLNCQISKCSPQPRTWCTCLCSMLIYARNKLNWILWSFFCVWYWSEVLLGKLQKLLNSVEWIVDFVVGKKVIKGWQHFLKQSYNPSPERLSSIHRVQLAMTAHVHTCLFISGNEPSYAHS